jgi:hypothetical protein
VHENDRAHDEQDEVLAFFRHLLAEVFDPEIRAGVRRWDSRRDAAADRLELRVAC